MTFSVIGELRAAVQAIADFSRWIARKHEAQGTAIAGKWTNEGDVTAAAEGRLPSHYVNLYLRVEGSDVSGIVQSRALDTGATLPNGSLNGWRRWGRISASVTDVRQGRLITYGHVVLRPRGRKPNLLLEWRLVNSTADFLPKATTLWKHDSEAIKWVQEMFPDLTGVPHVRS